MQNPVTLRSSRVASYNIRKSRGLDGRRDPGRIIDVLNTLEADVITLQEADHRLGPRVAALPKDMIEQSTDFQVVPLATNNVSLGWHGNAVLVRRGTEVVGTHRIPLPGVEPRGAVRVDFASGLCVIGVHLGLLRRSRRQQLTTITEQLGTPGHTVIIGDMNEWSAQKGLEALDAAFKVHSPGRSFHAARPMAALDRVALSKGVQLANAGVVQSPLAKRASDHLPIWADIVTANA